MTGLSAGVISQLNLWVRNPGRAEAGESESVAEAGTAVAGAVSTGAGAGVSTAFSTTGAGTGGCEGTGASTGGCEGTGAANSALFVGFNGKGNAATGPADGKTVALIFGLPSSSSSSSSSPAQYLSYSLKIVPPSRFGALLAGTASPPGAADEVGKGRPGFVSSVGERVRTISRRRRSDSKSAVAVESAVSRCSSFGGWGRSFVRIGGGIDSSLGKGVGGSVEAVDSSRSGGRGRL